MIPIADAHNDFLGYHALGDAGSRLFDHVDLDRLKTGGVKLQNFAVWVPIEHEDSAGCGRGQIAHLKRLLKEYPKEIQLCTRKEQLGNQNIINAILSLESGECIGCNAQMIEPAYTDGVRIMSLTWNNENDFASGCCAKGGLKSKGRHAIEELNRLHIAYDASHINEQGFWETVALYAHEPCATHSCAYTLANCPRNLYDDQIDYIIKQGGFIGINFYTEFLAGRYADVSDILCHIEYILARGGEKTVGLGSDFCGIQYTPKGLDSAADFQKIPEAMAAIGYNDELILQICYGNFADYILKFL